jgi:NAD(P)-dependent dehydrogenase (short-subunit alcohol dehydrogenase family)
MSGSERGLALVTGAGRGIGRASAVALGDAGYEVLCVARTADEVEATAGEINGRGGRARSATGDVTNSRAVGDLDLSGVTLVVNSAGINHPEPFVDVSEEWLERMLAVNVKATFLVCQAAVREMRSAGSPGVVINVSSQMGRVGAPRRTVYCATKHAVEGLTKAMAVELAPDRIRVNAVAPTFVDTPMTRPFFEDEAFRDDVLSRIPLGRIADVADVAAAIRFLASDEARMITGTSLLVDGGWTAQ